MEFDKKFIDNVLMQIEENKKKMFFLKELDVRNILDENSTFIERHAINKKEISTFFQNFKNYVKEE
jgi:hypothetical protein